MSRRVKQLVCLHKLDIFWAHLTTFFLRQCGKWYFFYLDWKQSELRYVGLHNGSILICFYGQVLPSEAGVLRLVNLYSVICNMLDQLSSRKSSSHSSRLATSSAASGGASDLSSPPRPCPGDRTAASSAGWLCRTCESLSLSKMALLTSVPVGELLPTCCLASSLKISWFLRALSSNLLATVF